jgi:hypothetical protein
MAQRSRFSVVRFAVVVVLATAGISGVRAALSSRPSIIMLAADPAGPTEVTTATGDEDATSQGPCAVALERAIVHVQTDDSAESEFVIASASTADGVGRSPLVVTNIHIVGDASRVTVWFSNGACRLGTVLNTNDRLDVVAIEVPRVPPAWSRCHSPAPRTTSAWESLSERGATRLRPTSLPLASAERLQSPRGSSRRNGYELTFTTSRPTLR